MIAASAPKASNTPSYRVGDERLIKVTASAAKKVSGLDIGLAIAAGVVALGAVVSVLLLLQLK